LEQKEKKKMMTEQLRKQIEVGSNLNLSIERKKYKKKIQIVT
jgi:hypothetical protein